MSDNDIDNLENEEDDEDDEIYYSGGATVGGSQYGRMILLAVFALGIIFALAFLIL